MGSREWVMETGKDLPRRHGRHEKAMQCGGQGYAIDHDGATGTTERYKVPDGNKTGRCYNVGGRHFSASNVFFMLNQLPPDISERLQAWVVAGGYQSEEEALREALDALDERDQEKRRRWHDGNALAIEQSRQGLSKPLDDEAVLARLRARLATDGITGG